MLSKGQTAGVRQRSNRIVELENAVELLKQEKKEDKQIFEKEKVIFNTSCIFKIDLKNSFKVWLK